MASRNADRQTSDFDAGVQAGLRTAADLLVQLAGRVQKPDATPPPAPTVPPAAASPHAGRTGPRGVAAR